MIEGPQEEYFTEAGKKTFYNETYTISDQSDRMGYRMEGAPIESVNGTDIIPDGIALGSIQVPNKWKTNHSTCRPADNRRIAKIATVCSFDNPKTGTGQAGGSGKISEDFVR